MKKAFQDSAAVLMALLVLFSTFSFTVDKHFCGSNLVDKAIFSEAKTCGMELHSSPKSAEASGDEDACCSNQKIAVDGQDDLKNSFHSLDFEQQVFLTGFTYSYLNLFDVLPSQINPFKDYSPPLLVSDIHLMDSVFLI